LSGKKSTNRLSFSPLFLSWLHYSYHRAGFPSRKCRAVVSSPLESTVFFSITSTSESFKLKQPKAWERETTELLEQSRQLHN
jgi:hypothetical protein